jgi:hypothetical protein
VPEQSPTDAEESQTLFERWQNEQRNWQRLITGYVDKAATDEAFLLNLGNAMRGSLMANTPYPWMAGPSESDTASARGEIDEVVFALRRLEGQVNELTMAIDLLTATNAAESKKQPAPNQDA